MGSAIRKPRIQPGRGSASDDSMIEGRTMVMGTVVPELADQGPLAQGLGVRVGVGPPEGLGPGLAHGDHLLLDPVLPQPLGPLGQQVEAGAAQLAAGRLGELRPDARAGATRRRCRRAGAGPRPPRSASPPPR